MDISKIKEANSQIRKAHFLAQCHHESMGFKVVEENLNYSAKGLKAVFGKYFNDTVKAEDYAYNKSKIANLVYGNRLGNYEAEDGYKYRGRGYIQLTGRDNYKSFGKYIGYDTENDPDVVSLGYPIESAAWFFTRNNLWQICDYGISEEVVRKLTKRINGGYNGIEERIKLTNMYYLKA